MSSPPVAKRDKKDRRRSGFGSGRRSVGELLGTPPEELAPSPAKKPRLPVHVGDELTRKQIESTENSISRLQKECKEWDKLLANFKIKAAEEDVQTLNSVSLIQQKFLDNHLPYKDIKQIQTEGFMQELIRLDYITRQNITNKQVMATVSAQLEAQGREAFKFCFPDVEQVDPRDLIEELIACGGED